MGNLLQFCKCVSNNIDELYIHLREEFTQQFSEKEIENLHERLTTFVILNCNVLVLKASKLYNGCKNGEFKNQEGFLF